MADFRLGKHIGNSREYSTCRVITSCQLSNSLLVKSSSSPINCFPTISNPLNVSTFLSMFRVFSLGNALATIVAPVSPILLLSELNLTHQFEALSVLGGCRQSFEHLQHQDSYGLR